MRTARITTSVSALATLILAATLSLASAAGGTDGASESSLLGLTRISSYKCTRTFETYAPRTFCTEMWEDPLSDDGFFFLVEDNILTHSCTYEAIGDPPNTQFGVGANFFCHGTNTATAHVGRIGDTTITGQSYWLNVVGGVRSVFTCEQVVTCP
jgi:hypothetical protein